MSDTEIVGLQDIAKAVGVTYNALWVAVRTARVILRSDPHRANEPYVATDDEVKTIRSVLCPDMVARRTTPAAITIQTRSAPAQVQPQVEGVDPQLTSLVSAALRMERRIEGK